MASVSVFEEQRWMTRPRFHCVIDPGHGAPTDAFRTSRRYRLGEGDINLRVAQGVRDRLSSDSEIDVTLTRSGPYPVSLDARTALAKQQNAHVFVSVHHNFLSMQTETLHHPTVFVHQPHRHVSPAVSVLGRLILERLRDRWPLRGSQWPPTYPASGMVSAQWVFPEGMAVLRNLASFCPAVISEAFFLSDNIMEKKAYEGSLVAAEVVALSEAIQQFVAQTGRLVRSVWSPLNVCVSDDEAAIHISGSIGLDGEVAKNVEIQVVAMGPQTTHAVSSGGTTIQFHMVQSIRAFLKTRQLALRVSGCTVFPDTFPCTAPYLRVQGHWSHIWTPTVMAAVQSGGYDVCPQNIADRARLSLKIFPNHPYRFETLLFLVERALAQGRFRHAVLGFQQIQWDLGVRSMAMLPKDISERIRRVQHHLSPRVMSKSDWNDKT